MSSSQEAAHAVMLLRDQRADVGRKLQQLSKRRAELTNTIRGATAEVENIDREMLRESVELGKLYGAIAAMENPRGYGGAPTWGASGAERRESRRIFGGG